MLGVLLATAVCIAAPLGGTAGAYVLLIPLAALVGWRLAPKRDALTIGPEGLEVRQRRRTSTRRRPTTFSVDWDDLKTIRVIQDKDTVRLVATFTSPGNPDWFRTHNIRHSDGGYELYRTPATTPQQTTEAATQLRQSLTPFTTPTD
ncbi:hypothetical protein DZF91_07645 [Actinomadura logoneensis]|uniref:Uncharacterized protein n=1 Tax=Actinomadura logoneensis TaxID=2293572 RepID=A0A372JQB6_9ACTN|nr:hypothetical protein [Actinomadura logoneensis]RFU42213.1 hypothetical protein DZF91_07645 [Actinomadura logoneensis]